MLVFHPIFPILFHSGDIEKSYKKFKNGAVMFNLHETTTLRNLVRHMYTYVYMYIYACICVYIHV